MIYRATSFLAFEAMVFGAAALVHAGVLLDGYEHARAATAEGVIAAVLLVGLAACLLRPGTSRAIALAVQAFALLGTLVGGFTIAIGVGPQTAADLAFHLLLVVLLLSGLVVVFKGPRAIGREQPGPGSTTFVATAADGGRNDEESPHPDRHEEGRVHS